MFLEVSYLGYQAHGLTGLVDVNPFPLGTNTRLNTDFSFLEEFQNVTHANYNGMTVNLRRTFSNMHGWGSSFFTLGYTWAHELDNVSGFRERNSGVPYYNHDEFYGSGDTDVRNALVLSGGWDLPFDDLWRSGPKVLTSGWSLYPIVTWHTGFPAGCLCRPRNHAQRPRTLGRGRCRLGACRPGRRLGGHHESPDVPEHQRQFRKLLFQPQQFLEHAPAEPGFDCAAGRLPASWIYLRHAGAQLFPGPGATNVDIAITKKFKISESATLELRGDAFNVFNHTQFSNPDTSISDLTFGQITSTASPRILQVALHLMF